jgi:hypothetical protein
MVAVVVVVLAAKMVVAIRGGGCSGIGSDIAYGIIVMSMHRVQCI